MSPHGFLTGARGVGFPRVSGDEPEASVKTFTPGEFSPRERG